MKIVVNKESLVKRCELVISNINKEQQAKTYQNLRRFFRDCTTRKYIFFGPIVNIATEEQLDSLEWMTKRYKEMVKPECYQLVFSCAGDDYKWLATSIINACKHHQGDTVELDKEDAYIFTVWDD